jgi:hypothetical protein
LLVARRELVGRGLNVSLVLLDLKGAAGVLAFQFRIFRKTCFFQIEIGLLCSNGGLRRQNLRLNSLHLCIRSVDGLGGLKDRRRGFDLVFRVGSLRVT